MAIGIVTSVWSNDSIDINPIYLCLDRYTDTLIACCVVEQFLLDTQILPEYSCNVLRYGEIVSARRLNFDKRSTNVRLKENE